MTSKKHHKLIILGSGPAGYTAAIYAARANLDPVIITGMEQGGQLTTTGTIDNWPGDVMGVQGADLMHRMLEHAERFAAKIIFDTIMSTDLQQHPFYLKGDSAEYTCDALIIATGASAKYLGLPSEKKYLGKGVSACAVCDGYFYKNKKVIVVGGRNTALHDALYLSKIANEVTIVHRRDSFTAEEIVINEVMKLNKSGNVKIEWDSIIEEILGDEHGVTGIRIKSVKEGKVKDWATDGVFIAIGHIPNSDIFTRQLEMENGYIKISRNGSGNFTATNIPGVFAAGDIADNTYQQAITAAGMGCMAALDAKHYLK